jgi:hypothetical protein
MLDRSAQEIAEARAIGRRLAVAEHERAIARALANANTPPGKDELRARTRRAEDYAEKLLLGLIGRHAD